MASTITVDVAIFGGGVAGLWLLDELRRHGFSGVLLEAGDLGGGQTIASQGILHGGAKYALSGIANRAAQEVRDMPELWRDCLAGRCEPDLSQTRVRSSHCYLWRTGSLASRLGMLGARVGLRVAPQRVEQADRPALLASCPGMVARLDEQVIAPADLLASFLQRNRESILKIDAECGLDFELSAAGVEAIQLLQPITGEPLILRPRRVVLTAGAGNSLLRERLGLPTAVMQRRPLHVALARGALPFFSGHCIDGAETRVTITADVDAAGRVVWQIGGRLAERGVSLDGAELIRFARAELLAVLPGLHLSEAEWASYRIDRAELASAGGRRPDTAQIIQEGNVTTAWPTKLVLAPKLAERIVSQLPPSSLATDACAWLDWPRPKVALAPWEACTSWQRLGEDFSQSEAA
ncbi:MAG TPA: FAD-dependent oxidoreductase [Pirellulales bacterium]|nr:FAD-dependent oxidoreductase [Pirellulales bacterium]